MKSFRTDVVTALLLLGIAVASSQADSQQLMRLIADHSNNAELWEFQPDRPEDSSAKNAAATLRSWRPKVAAGETSDDGFLPGSGAISLGVRHGGSWPSGLETREPVALAPQTTFEFLFRLDGLPENPGFHHLIGWAWVERGQFTPLYFDGTSGELGTAMGTGAQKDRLLRWDLHPKTGHGVYAAVVLDFVGDNAVSVQVFAADLTAGDKTVREVVLPRQRPIDAVDFLAAGVRLRIGTDGFTRTGGERSLKELPVTLDFLAITHAALGKEELNSRLAALLAKP